MSVLIIALITNIGDSHLEYLKIVKVCLKEKSALFKETIKHGGKVFINNDDTIIKASILGKTVKSKITFGFHEKADVQSID
ncbi:MAG: Mur ligase family protein [Ignavibacteriales bacterium]|nr:Mur ligase family protein [Ignavibacteriales bacterium]